MQTELGLTKRQIKSAETKEKLCDAMIYIMDEYDYNTVTIRNICKVSGVSYGSFYNLFDSKEDFLRYYLTSDFTKFKENYYQEHKEFQALSNIEKSIDIFVCCARYNVSKGIKFIKGFYSPDNKSLCPLENEGQKEYSFTPLVREAIEYLEQAKKDGTLKEETDIRQLVNEYCFLFNGITFNWCISNGKYDMVGLTRQYLTEYVQSQNK